MYTASVLRLAWKAKDLWWLMECSKTPGGCSAFCQEAFQLLHLAIHPNSHKEWCRRMTLWFFRERFTVSELSWKGSMTVKIPQPQQRRLLVPQRIEIGWFMNKDELSERLYPSVFLMQKGVGLRTTIWTSLAFQISIIRTEAPHRLGCCFPSNSRCDNWANLGSIHSDIHRVKWSKGFQVDANIFTNWSCCSWHVPIRPFGVSFSEF